MAQVEEVIIRIVGDTSKLEPTLKKLREIGVIVEKDEKKFKSANRSMQRELDQTGKKAKKFGDESKKASEKASKSFDATAKRASLLGLAMIGAFAIKKVVSAAIEVIKKFEKELSTLQSITGSTTTEMQFFSKAAKDIGRDTKTSATDVVKAFTLIGSAQPELLKNSEALAEVTKQALILSKAAGIDATVAATALTSAMNQFGVSAKDAAKFTDIFATSQQKGSSFIQATSLALKNSGAAASAAGLSFETTNAAIQALAKGAIVGSEAGTALRGVLIKLSSQADNDINPSMVGLSKTIENLAKRNLSLRDATKLVGMEGATGLLTLIKQRDILFELDGNLNDVGNAMNQMAINTDNLDSRLEELNQEWEQSALNLGIFAAAQDSAVKGLLLLLQATGDSGDEMEKYIDLLGGPGSASVQKIFREFDSFGTRLQGLKDEARAFGLETEGMFETMSKTEAIEKWLAIQRLISGETDEATEEIAEQTQTIGELKKEITELRKAQNNLIPGSKELAESQARITEIQAILKGEIIKSLTPMDKLNKRIATLKKELESQAVAGELSTDTIKEYKTAVRQAEEAVIDLNKALEDTLKTLPLMNTELNELFIFDVPMVEFTSAIEDFMDANGDRIDQAIEAEQALFRIVSQNNTNKLIGIDNEEIKALRLLEAQGLGEQELADKRLEIQTKSDEERAKILTKQAKADKAAALFDAGINLAVAVTKALATTANPIFAILIAGLAAVELAAIAAAPIPEFHEGKKSELKEGEMYAKILRAETVIPPEQSKRHKGLLDAVIDKNLESYVMREYMMPIFEGMGRNDAMPFDDFNLWSMLNKQNKTMKHGNMLTERLIKSMDSGNGRRSWS